MNKRSRFSKGIITAGLVCLVAVLSMACTGTKPQTPQTPPKPIEAAPTPPTTTTPTSPLSGVVPDSMASMPTLTITMKDNLFTPAEMKAAPSTMITWVNEDKVPHSVSIDAGNLKVGRMGGPNTVDEGIKPGGKWVWMIPPDAKPGTTWYYHCIFNGKGGDGKSRGTGMTGVIIVEAPKTSTTPPTTPPKPPAGTPPLGGPSGH